MKMQTVVFGPDTDTPKNNCSRCGSEMDAATGFDPEARPKEGSISMCAYCGKLALFNADLTLRPLTDAEQEDLLNSMKVDNHDQYEILKLIIDRAEWGWIDPKE
jgi:uncharacterized protein (DUF983 family)